MAVSGEPELVPPRPHGLAVLRTFASLRLRILRNGFRGRPSRVVLFIFGLLAMLYLAGVGFLLFAASAAGDANVRLMVAAYGGAILVVGSILMPLIWFGVDESLDPARLALLPLPRRHLMAGLLVGALLGVPAVGLFATTAGLLVPAIQHGGVVAGVGQAVGLVAGLLLCVCGGRAVTSAFATMLRSRRARDLAGILLASVAALVAPVQLAVMSAARDADWDRLTDVARVVGWTPLGAPYTIGYDLAEGAPLAATAKLLITLVTIAALLWWWFRSIESAMVGAVASGQGKGGRLPREGAVRSLFPRMVPGLPTTAAGAMVARELRYWWRDAKRRSSLIMVAVMACFLPMLFMLSGRIAFDDPEAIVAVEWSSSPTVTYLTALFVGAFTASVLANQFGVEGTAYAQHLIVAVPGRRELLTRAIAYSIYMVPILVLVGAAVAVVRGDAALAPALWGMLLAGYGAGLAVSMVVSILAAYPMPENSNPFAVNTGSGVVKSFVALVGLVAAYAAATPVLLLGTHLIADIWPQVAVPVGVAYGAGAVWLGSYLGGDLLERRSPEVLAAVTPRR